MTLHTAGSVEKKETERKLKKFIRKKLIKLPSICVILRCLSTEWKCKKETHTHKKTENEKLNPMKQHKIHRYVELYH